MRLLLLLLMILTEFALGDLKETVINKLDDQNEITNIIEDGCKEDEAGMVSQICREEISRECGVCHTMYIKECQITMEPKNTPVKMKMCMKVVGDSDCKEGYRRSCRTWYESECGTKWRFQEIVEDRPVCGVQMVGKCQDRNNKGEDEDEDGSERDCVEVPVMKCQIEKKKVRKRMPRTACRRIPRQFCIKKKCKRKKIKCFDKIQIISELTPVESCNYIPKKICQETEEPDTNCRTVKRQICQPDKLSSPNKRKICRKSIEVDNEGEV